MFLNSALNSLVSRRGFVGGAVGGLAAAGLTACGVPDATDGAGAARAAALLGARASRPRPEPAGWT